MYIFVCNYCNKNINTGKNIYYAYDYKFCSILCRLNSLRENDLKKNPTSFDTANFYNKFKGNNNDKIDFKTNCTIKSSKSINKLSEYSNNSNNSNNNSNNIKEKVPRECNTYLEYTLNLTSNLIMYIINIIYTSR